jgi:MYXO-CTERM domain-containing protein
VDDTPENPPGVPGGLTSLAPSDCTGCATGSRPLGYLPLLALGALVWGRRKRGATS